MLVGTAERREMVESKWKELDVDRRRMLVDELAEVTPAPEGKHAERVRQNSPE